MGSVMELRIVFKHKVAEVSGSISRSEIDPFFGSLP